MGPVFGGDPASTKRARQALEEAQLTAATESPAIGDTHVVDYERKPKFRLPLLAGKAPTAVPTVEALVSAANATALWVKAPDLAAAAPEITRFAGVTEVDLELEKSRLFAAGVAGECAVVYRPKRGIYDWGGCAVGGLDAAARYAAFWFDPATGRRFPLADVTGSERFVTPPVPSPQDWVLVLRRW